MMRKPKVKQTVLWLLVLGFPLIAFQNCSGVLRFGNGGGYEGESRAPDGDAAQKVIYVNYEAPACADGKARHQLVLSVGEYEQAQLTRRDCEDLTPALLVSVISSSERPNPNVIVYANKIFRQEANPPPGSNPGGVGLSPGVALYCVRQVLSGTQEVQVAGDPTAGYQAVVSITTNAGSARAEISVNTPDDGFPNGSFVVQGSNVNNGTNFTLSVDVAHVAASMDYRLRMTMPAAANWLDPIFGAYVNNSTWQNIVSPMLCFTPNSPQNGTN